MIIIYFSGVLIGLALPKPLIISRPAGKTYLDVGALSSQTWARIRCIDHSYGEQASTGSGGGQESIIWKV